MKTLEEELEILRNKLCELDERLRLRRVTESFPDAPIGPGDFFTNKDETGCGRLSSIDSDGDWNYSWNGTGWSGRGPADAVRLFTRAEVEQIVAEAKARR